MLAAGLVAKKAVEKGLTDEAVGQDEPGARLEGGHRLPHRRRPDAVRWKQLRFNLVGYGCTTCIGNSGPLPAAVSQEHRGRRPRRRGGPQRQSQLRGPRPSRSARQLPRVAAAGRRLRARRPHRHRSAHRAARRTTRRQAGLSQGHLADAAGSQRRRRAVGARGDVHKEYGEVFKGDEHWQ